MRRGMLLALGLMVSACAVNAEASPNRCSESGTCSGGRSCVRPAGLRDDEPGFCITGMPGMDAGIDGGADAAPVDAGCELGTAINCTGCGDACDGSTPVCEAQGGGSFSCVATCSGTLCSETCVDLMSDDANCGGCGDACDPDANCDRGECRCAGRDCGDLTCCGGTCLDLNDAENCGACGSGCATGATCESGRCACGSSDEDCRQGRVCSAVTNSCL